MKRRSLESMPQYEVFREGSRTYFNSSLFFPADIRRDVFILYAFVRVADNFVDDEVQDEAGFANFCRSWEAAECGTASGNPLIDDFVDLSRRRGFESSWTHAFLASMAIDLEQVAFDHLQDTLAYIYGSAEVIGLYMSRIMNLDENAFPYARLLGRSMQYINFLRDIQEDNGLGRRYLPIAGSGLKSLQEDDVRAMPGEFETWFRQQVNLYKIWHQEAMKGYRFIPPRYLLPIRTAEDMYYWTAEKLEKNPFMVFQRKVKPSKSRILTKIAANVLHPVNRRRFDDLRTDIPGGMAVPEIRDFAYIRGTCE